MYSIGGLDFVRIRDYKHAMAPLGQPAGSPIALHAYTSFDRRILTNKTDIHWSLNTLLGKFGEV